MDQGAFWAGPRNWISLWGHGDIECFAKANGEHRITTFEEKHVEKIKPTENQYKANGEHRIIIFEEKHVEKTKPTENQCSSYQLVSQEDAKKSKLVDLAEVSGK